MPPKRERVRGETLGSLYRALCSEADGRRKDVRRERLLIMEQLGYLKRKNRAEPASTLHLGKFARGRPKALPKPPADGAKEARERAENRRKLLYAEGVSSAETISSYPLSTASWSVVMASVSGGVARDGTARWI